MVPEQHHCQPLMFEKRSVFFRVERRCGSVRNILEAAVHTRRVGGGRGSCVQGARNVTRWGYCILLSSESMQQVFITLSNIEAQQFFDMRPDIVHVDGQSKGNPEGILAVAPEEPQHSRVHLSHDKNGKR